MITRPVTQDTERNARRSAMQAWVRALDYSRILDDSTGTTLCSSLDELANQYGDRPALLGDGEEFSFRDLAARANRYARWAMAEGLGSGDVVCLLMANRPDYVAVWLGLTRAGCVVALLNTNLVADALLHSFRAAGSERLIVGDTLLPRIADILPPGTRVWVHGHAGHGDWPALEPELARHAPTPISDKERSPPTPADRALLIYTSGTSGLPKAANVTHARVLEWSYWFAGMMDTQPTDRLYDCLPMYHSTGGVVAIGAMLVKGGSVLIRARFSAGRFWDDVVDGNCTIFQYIGELCRYLVASPPHAKERKHRLRLACGNGMQGDVWEALQARFEIPQILEFYAATEGNVSLYNCEGKPGAIGRVPPFLAHRFPVVLVRFDSATGAPLRDAAGRCVACGPNETGEAIGQVLAGRGLAARNFDGYTDREASSNKLLRDVFAAGDRWFRTGDLMRKDEAGFFYFADRVGDTFRWKGENVSTMEVAAAIRRFAGVTEAVVYGVPIPGHEGRAGMAAITTDSRFDIERFPAHLAAVLPGYARPLFLRCCETLDATGTYKLTKAQLAQDGFSAGGDPVWFNDRRTGRFIACDTALLESIAAGAVPL